MFYQATEFGIKLCNWSQNSSGDYTAMFYGSNCSEKSCFECTDAPTSSPSESSEKTTNPTLNPTLNPTGQANLSRGNKRRINKRINKTIKKHINKSQVLTKKAYFTIKSTVSEFPNECLGYNECEFCEIDEKELIPSMLENKADNDFCGYSDMDDLKKHPWAYWDLETLRGNLMTIKSGPGIKKVWPANQYLDLVDEVFPQRVTDVAQAWLIEDIDTENSLVVIRSNIDGKCLGFGEEKYPKMVDWNLCPEGDVKWCGFVSKEELIANKQAVWKVEILWI